MTPDEFRRVKHVLEDALQRDAGEWAAFLDQACAGDDELRRRVEALLRSDREMGEFLSRPLAAGVRGPLTPPPASGDTHELPPRFPAGRIGPYRLVREIGHGGMGTVYLAERADGQFRMRAAVKVIRPALRGEVIARRFRNERQVLAGLDHPNIARLLDGGETEGGSLYLVMEYVDGERIDAWCDSRKLPVRDRLALVQRICAAVQYAHDKQVIHRDLKPGNILVSADGTPKLLDFGIAKALDPELHAEAAQTLPDALPMTPEYSSPEQVRGEPVGPASDIYSLGLVLYELLTGHRPYKVPASDLKGMARVICGVEPVKPSETIRRLMEADPADPAPAAADTVSANRAESPASPRRRLRGDVDDIVMKALRKEPERRYASAALLGEDIERWLKDLPVRARGPALPYRARKFIRRNRMTVAAAALTAASVLALVFGLGRFADSGGDREDGVRSIAVLPLENLSRDPEQEYFADGMTDALIDSLARIRDLRVISRTSVMTLKGTRRRIPEIARDLGVETITEGSVLRAGADLRIAVRLIKAAEERSMWSGRYEGTLDQVAALQDQMVGDIAGEIHVTLTAPRAARDRRVNVAAYDAYLKGRREYLAEFTQASTDKAIAYFQQALRLDPGYAPAYAGLADCFYMVSSIYHPPAEVIPKAKAAAIRAIELDDALGEAHATLALVRSLYEFNYEEAELGFKRAIELKPSDAQARVWYSLHLAAMGRFDEALAEVDRARKLDPVSPAMNGYIGPTLYVARRYDQAIQRMQLVIERHPEYVHPYAWTALSYEQKGEWAKAIAAMEKAYALDGEPQSLAQLGHMYAASGREADARKALRQLRDLSSRRFVSVYDIALIHVGLGELDEAFRWLNKVEEDRSEWFAFLNVDPRLDAIRSDPRFGDLLRKVGLVK